MQIAVNGSPPGAFWRSGDLDAGNRPCIVIIIYYLLSGERGKGRKRKGSSNSVSGATKLYSLTKAASFISLDFGILIYLSYISSNTISGPAFPYGTSALKINKQHRTAPTQHRIHAFQGLYHGGEDRYAGAVEDGTIFNPLLF